MAKRKKKSLQKHLQKKRKQKAATTTAEAISQAKETMRNAEGKEG